jgi:hypothetical protein
VTISALDPGEKHAALRMRQQHVPHFFTRPRSLRIRRTKVGNCGKPPTSEPASWPNTAALSPVLHASAMGAIYLTINFPISSTAPESECMKTLALPNMETLPIEPFRSHGFETSAKFSGIKSIVFPEPGQVRSRKVVSRSNARSTGKFPSWKMGRMIHWESINELNAFRLLDCDPNVTSYSEQPCQIVYVMDGIERVHYPDILVTTTGGRQLWEVKLQSNASEPEFLARATFLSRALPRWGYEYRTVFGEELARQPRLNNANLLLSLGKRPVSDCEWEDVRLRVAEQGALVWSEANSGHYGAKGREILSSLVLRGVLTIDMNSPISPATEFVAKNGGL